MYPNRPASRSESIRRNSVSRSGSRIDKERVCLAHGCYICGNTLSTASATRNHIARIHGMSLPPRERNFRRPQDKEYSFVSQDEEYDSDHYACPSCWFHCPQDELDSLNYHTLKEHDPQPVQENGGNNQDEDDNEEEEDEDMPKSSGRRQSFSSNRPSSRQQSKRPLSRSNSRSSMRRNSNSSFSASRPNSRQGNRPSSRAEANDDVGEIGKKLDELVNLFKAMFN